MKKNIVFVILLSCILTSCFVLINGRYGREPLKMNREPMYSNKLRTDGFYNFNDGRSFLNLVLYKNGVILTPYATPYDSKKNKIAAEDYFKTITKESNPYHDIVYSWGIFKVDSNNLTIEKWVSGDGGHKYNTMIRKGKILNDSSFVFPLGSSITKLDTFRFVKTSVKPDSTCPFIPIN